MEGSRALRAAGAGAGARRGVRAWRAVHRLAAALVTVVLGHAAGEAERTSYHQPLSSNI